MKERSKISEEVRRSIKVTEWSMEVFGGRSSAVPPSAHEHELTILKLKTSSSKWQFWVYVYPDGTQKLPIRDLPEFTQIHMGISACQLPALLHLLNSPQGVEASYWKTSSGAVFADVHATFKRSTTRKS
jgi:hypothetical protein